jgi:hypothetical protein
MTRILCIGADEGLLRTRYAVLAQVGYIAMCGLFSEAERILRSGVIRVNPVTGHRINPTLTPPCPEAECHFFHVRLTTNFSHLPIDE